MGGGKGGADVEYSQSPEQRAVYQALQPMVQRLGQQYAPTTTGGMPTTTSVPIMQLPAQSQIKNLAQEGRIGGYPIIKSSTPGRYDVMLNLGDLPKSIKREYIGDPYSKYTQWGGSLPASMFQPEHLQQYFPQIYSAPSKTTQPTLGELSLGGGLYDIPHPAGAVSAVSPLVSPAFWKPYQQAEERLMDIYQSRGQLGAPGAGLSGAAAAGLGEFYSQAAKDIGLQSYQMGMPLWQAQLQREAMPWQMLPGLLGGTYSTGIAQQGGGMSSALAGGLGGAGAGLALNTALGMTNPWLLPVTLGAAGLMGGK